MGQRRSFLAQAQFGGRGFATWGKCFVLGRGEGLPKGLENATLVNMFHKTLKCRKKQFFN